MLYVLQSAGAAQEEVRYLVSCSLNVSADSVLNIYLNNHLVDRVSHMSVLTGPQTIISRPSSLCFFQHENILAFELAGPAFRPALAYETYGFAYSMDLVFSDGSRRVLTSSERNQHLSLYLQDKLIGNPRDWETLEFNESGWQIPYTSASIPGLPEVWNQQSGIPAGYLSASKKVPLGEGGGDRQLFRRKFLLEMAPAPQCGESKTAANLFISFEEGPGIYKVEILDMEGRHIKTPFQKKVVRKTNAWVPWDGKNEKGEPASSGTYQAVYTKDGSPLRTTDFTIDMTNP